MFKLQFSRKTLILTIAACFLSLAALIAYLIDPGDYRSPAVVIILSVAAIVCSAAVLFLKRNFGIPQTLAAGLNLLCFVLVAASQLNNIAMTVTNVGLGNSGVPISFWFSAVFYLAATVCNSINVFQLKA